MAYIDTLPLATVKNHLRIDAALAEDDNALTAMVNTALSYIEVYTNHILDSRDKTYIAVDGCIRIYDHPITAFVGPGDESDFTITKKNLYSIYEKGIDTIDDLELTVGYAPNAVPSALISVALEMIELMYYGNDNDKNWLNQLPGWAIMALDQYRRFNL
jgi:hypothetical protein